MGGCLAVSGKEDDAEALAARGRECGRRVVARGFFGCCGVVDVRMNGRKQRYESQTALLQLYIYFIIDRLDRYRF